MAACRFTAELRGYRLGSAAVGTAPASPFSSYDAAAQACLELGLQCGGVVQARSQSYELSASAVLAPSPTGGAAWVKLCTDARCVTEDGVWYWGAHLVSLPRASRASPHLPRPAASHMTSARR